MSSLIVANGRRRLQMEAPLLECGPELRASRNEGSMEDGRWKMEEWMILTILVWTGREKKRLGREAKVWSARLLTLRGRYVRGHLPVL